MQAEIAVRYPSTRVAKSVLQGLTPDNRLARKGMRITAKAHGRILTVMISGCKKVETLQATALDIFRCIRAAETAIEVLDDSKSKKNR